MATFTLEEIREISNKKVKSLEFQMSLEPRLRDLDWAPLEALQWRQTLMLGAVSMKFNWWASNQKEGYRTYDVFRGTQCVFQVRRFASDWVEIQKLCCPPTLAKEAWDLLVLALKKSPPSPPQ